MFTDMTSNWYVFSKLKVQSTKGKVLNFLIQSIPFIDISKKVKYDIESIFMDVLSYLHLLPFLTLNISVCLLSNSCDR